PVMSAVPAVELERSGEAFLERHEWPPAKTIARLPEIGVVVANVDREPLRRKLLRPYGSLAVQPDQQLSQFGERDYAVGAEVEHLAAGVLVAGGEQKGSDRIVDVVEITSLRPVTEDHELFPDNQCAEPLPEECLSCIADTHPWPVRVGQPEHRQIEAV